MQREREVMCLEFVTIAPNLKGTIINYSWGGGGLLFRFYAGKHNVSVWVSDDHLPQGSCFSIKPSISTSRRTLA